jgi:PAS domain S-box-containing protein
METQVIEVERVQWRQEFEELKQRLERVEKERTFLRQVIDINPNLIFAKDRLGRFTLANQAVADFYGTSIEAILGKTDVDFNSTFEIFETFRRDNLEVMDKLQEKVIPEETLIDANGQLHYLQTVKRPIVEVDGQAHQILLTSTDITRRKHTEEALRSSEARYRAIVEDQIELVWRFGPDKLLTFVNEAYCRYFNQPRELLIGHPFMSVVFNEDYRRVSELIASIGWENPVITHEHRIGLAIGELRWHLWTHRAIFDEQGQLIEFQSVGRDITKRKQAEEELRQRNAENARLAEELAQVKIGQELDRLRAELIANVSHELRTPLGLIKLFATTLLRPDLAVDPQLQTEFLGNIAEETDKLEKIVDNLLDLSRVESKRLHLDRRLTNLGELIEKIVKTIEIQFFHHHFVYADVGEPLLVMIDPARIEQVLRNLLVNAAKYSPSGGTITIQGGRQLNQVFVRVGDQGIGLAPPDLERIFERFYRVDSEQTRNIGGAGLGLAVCKGIIEAHGGRIWAESTPQAGSTFHFTLPA